MRFRYFIAETLTNLKRNILMTVAAVSTVVIALLLLGGVQILGLIVKNMTLTWESKVELSVYLLDDATEGEVGALTTNLKGMGEVLEVTYVSKGQAFEDFKQIWRNNPELYQNLPKDSLPASLRVKLTNAEFTDEVGNRVEGAPGVDEVRGGGEFVRRLLQVNSLLRTTTFAMSIVLMVASAGLIANTIRVAIYARREEISIMKLVGATNWFIRIPFMLEGVIAALTGALVAGGVVLMANGVLFSRIGDSLPAFRQVFTFSTAEVGTVMLVLVGVGTLVGVVGSGLALRRFLEV